MTDPLPHHDPQRNDPANERATLVLTHRLLVFSGSAWLLSSWLIVIGMRQPMLPSISTWLPGVRLMLAMSAIGLIIVWPMAALSSRSPIPAGRTLRDALILLILAQLIVWPAAMVMAWTLPRAAMIAAQLTGWGLLAAAVTAWGRRVLDVRTRTTAMALCLAMVLVVPGILMIAPQAPVMNWSPLTSLWSLAEGGIDDPAPTRWRDLSVLTVAVLVAWSIVGCLRPKPVTTGSVRP